MSDYLSVAGEQEDATPDWDSHRADLREHLAEALAARAKAEREADRLRSILNGCENPADVARRLEALTERVRELEYNLDCATVITNAALDVLKRREDALWGQIEKRLQDRAERRLQTRRLWLSQTYRERAEKQVDSLTSALNGALERVGYLEAWLESRGLPKDWTGPLDAWAWLVWGLDNHRVVGVVITASIRSSDVLGEVSNIFPNVKALVIRWDRATPEQRAEAIAAEMRAAGRTP